MKEMFYPKQYWNKRIASVSDCQAIGRIDLPDRVNEMRKKRLFGRLDEIYSQRGIDLQTAAVLDAGCGNGIYSRYYAERGAEVVGIDFSDEAISLLKKTASMASSAWGQSVRFLTGQIHLMSFIASRYSIILSTTMRGETPLPSFVEFLNQEVSWYFVSPGKKKNRTWLNTSSFDLKANISSVSKQPA